MIETLKSIPKGLTNPGSYFSKEDFLKNSILVLLLVFYLLTLSASLSNLKVMNSQGYRDFQIEMSYQLALKNMPSATEEQKAHLRENITQELNKPFQRIAMAVSAFMGPLFAIVGIIIFWVYMMIVFRFVGGEEAPVEIQTPKGNKLKRHRRTLYLAVFAFLPVALSGTVMGIQTLLRDPDYYLNMLSLSQAIERMNTPVSLYTLLIDAQWPLWIEVMLNIFTSPFYWWFAFIVMKGSEAILGIKPIKTLILVVVYLLLYGNYQWGTMAISQAFTG